MCTDNPWNIKSIYELQYFICPSCEFKNSSKQEIINHAYEQHPKSIDFLTNISDDSLNDIICPWNLHEIKIEGDAFMGIDPLCIKTEPDIDLNEENNFNKVYIKEENEHFLENFSEDFHKVTYFQFFH